ncbi:MAG: trigger factor [Anaerovoracaceae bacterium]|jgi:trigger factor
MKKGRKIALLLAVCVGVVMSLSACGRPYSGYDLSDYIKVGKYKGLEVAKYTVNVTDKDVNKEIKSRLEAKASTKEVKTGTVKDGDTVVITYDGKINGKTFDDGSAKGANLTIGSGQFIDGFEDGLIGMKVGDTRTLNLKFPDDYSNKDVAGKKVSFKVTVDAKQEKVTPKLDEDFVKQNSKVDTVAAYKKLVKKDLEKKQRESGIQTQKQYLWNKVVESSTVKKNKNGKEKYPQDEIDKKVEQQKDMYTQYAKNYNMSYKDFLKQQMGTTPKEFNKQLRAYAKTLVKQDEVVYYIADKENIDVSKKEYKNFIKNTLKQYGYTEKSYKEANNESYEDTVGKDNIMSSVYLDKVQDLILDKAKVLDKVDD